MSSQIEMIKDFIAQGDTENALRWLIYSAKNTPYINAALQLSGRLKKEQFNLINGISEGNIELNKISTSVLVLADELLKTENRKNELKINQPLNKSDESDRDEVFNSVIGLDIDKYSVTGYIHSGGFGSVYKAKHKNLGHTYALKISHEIEEGFDFLDEIISLGVTGLQLLNHSNIVKTYDVGEVIINNTNRIYIVMEFVEGGTLADLSKFGLKKEDVWKRIEIFKKICLGIHYAHNLRYTNRLGFQVRGLMHGDIKPANILLTLKRGA